MEAVLPTSDDLTSHQLDHLFRRLGDMRKAEIATLAEFGCGSAGLEKAWDAMQEKVVNAIMEIQAAQERS